MSPNFANSNSVVIVAIIFDNKSCVQHYRQTEMAAGIAQATQILKGDNMVGERKKKKAQERGACKTPVWSKISMLSLLYYNRFLS